ncbi:spore germination protein [Sutcliffiella halmapala]|uniref:spore germination protein n=1 Tax=Sutcliffiella halmapala TaxID=79882 RepID=UPI000994DD4D|nr:spore germination protein [Sutcliffiella halmapala]
MENVKNDVGNIDVQKYSPLVEELFRQFSHTEDFVVKEMEIHNKWMLLCYLEPLVDKEKLNKLVLKLYEYIENGEALHFLNEFNVTVDKQAIFQQVMEGNTPLFIAGLEESSILDTKLNISRSSDEPSNERVIRGSHDGFIEHLSSNINILRNRISNPNLSIQYRRVGTISNSKCAIIYMRDLVDKDFLSDVISKIENINIEHVTSVGIIEEFLEENSYSPFPQILHTERPDRVAANILDGRVAVMVNGTPGVLILPVSFFAFYQSPDDYSSRWLTGSFYRIIRLISFFFAISLPAIYISIISFHAEVIPKGLVQLAKKSVEEIPYPPIIEAFILEITLELLREAGIRLPNPIGQTIGIVGGLVIGDAVVRAGLVSNLMIIVVALTAISSFIVPTHEMSAAVRVVRFPLMILAATLGFMGIIYGFAVIFIHLVRLEPFGKPYFSPFAPFKLKEIKDTFIRLPMYYHNNSKKGGDKSPKASSVSREK